MAKAAQSTRAAAPAAAPPPDVLAAGAVVFREGKQVLLVHRPRYDDWSFPKGKLDRGEHALSAAVREVQEETGLVVRLGASVPGQRYSVGKRMKTVRYWVGHAVGSDDISHYWPNDEVDDLRWVSLAKAPELLTYPHDRKTLRKAGPWRQPTNTLVIVRHALARSRRAWRGDDPVRPLLKTGAQQAQRLVPLLASYDVTRVVTSSSERCLRTVTPYAEQRGLKVRRKAELSEEGSTPEAVRAIITRLLAREENSVICTHRPVLSWVGEALGIDAIKLDPGAFLVVHHRAGHVLATEHHQVR